MAGAQDGHLTIALIGMRGSGKSTVGRELADRLGRTSSKPCSFVDTDELIRQRTGRTIAQVFRDSGEAEFRRLEREVIAEMVASPPDVISVGGGAIMDGANVKALQEVATVVWLVASPDVLWVRLQNDATTTTSRPPLTDKKGLEELRLVLEERTCDYEQAAEFCVDTADKNPAEVAEEVLSRIRHIS